MAGRTMFRDMEDMKAGESVVIRRAVAPAYSLMSFSWLYQVRLFRIGRLRMV